MSASLTLPSSELAKLSAAMRTLVAATGRNGEEITRAFAARILKRWAGRTKVTTEAQINRRARSRTAKALNLQKADANPAGLTINNGARGGHQGEVWVRTSRYASDAARDQRSAAGYSRGGNFRQAGLIVGSNSFSFTPSWYHWRSAQWREINYLAGEYAQRLAARLRAGLKSIGLARQSVVQIADSLGIDLAAVPGSGISAAGLAKARAAIASNGQKYLNGQGAAYRNASRFFIELTNSFPKNVRMGMDAVLAGVIAGEVKYYEKNLEHGVFFSAAQTARAYPFLRVEGEPLRAAA